MVYFGATLIFLAITVTIWGIGLVLYQAFLGEPALRAKPHFWLISTTAVSIATLICFTSFPANYFLTLAVWLVAVHGGFSLPWIKAVVLFGILAALTFLSRLAVLGALQMF